MARTAAASGIRIEHGLIAAGIAVAIIAAVNGLGSQVKATFVKLNSMIK
jgi:pilus assembly protein Flp/PilA